MKNNGSRPQGPVPQARQNDDGTFEALRDGRVDLDFLTTSPHFALTLNARPEALFGRIERDVVIKADIRDWRFLRLKSVTPDVPATDRHFLIGYRGNDLYMTSHLEVIDLEQHLVRTANSHYRLAGDPGDDNLPIHLLLHISWCFDNWGWGKTLGTRLQVFY